MHNKTSIDESGTNRYDCKVVAKACYDQRERLAKMAAEETGFGKWQDKVLKNALASKGILEEIKDICVQLVF